MGNIKQSMPGQRIGYIRVSSLDQHVERQLEGTEVDKTFTDKASGKDTKRPQLELLAHGCRTSTVVQLILCAISSISSAVLDVVTPVSFIATTNKG